MIDKPFVITLDAWTFPTNNDADTFPVALTLPLMSIFAVPASADVTPVSCEPLPYIDPLNDMFPKGTSRSPRTLTSPVGLKSVVPMLAEEERI